LRPNQSAPQFLIKLGDWLDSYAQVLSVAKRIDKKRLKSSEKEWKKS